MKRADILQLRLWNQGVTAPRFERPQEVVALLGALQAQDYGMSLWAAGLRLTVLPTGLLLKTLSIPAN